MGRIADSYRHRGGDTPLLGETIPQRFALITSRFEDREAAVFRQQGQRLTYGALRVEVDRLARGMSGLGFDRGDRIGVWSTDNLGWLLIQMATARIGAILVTINPAYRPRELAYALEKSAVQGLFTIPRFRDTDYVGVLRDLLPGLAAGEPGHDLADPDLPHLRRVIVWDPSDPMETVRPAPGFSLWREVLAAGTNVTAGALDAATAALDRDDPVNIQYTSGTTGFPKAVMLTHLGLLNNAYFAARAMGFAETDRLCVPVPFYHCFGAVLANLLCLSVGACLVVPAEHFDTEATLATIQEERCTALHGVPTMFVAQLDHPRFSEFDLSSLRTGIMAGAPCPEALMKRVIEDMHCREILIGYGQTEASPLTHLTERSDGIAERTTTVGRNLPHQEVKVIDPKTGATVPVDTIGEVCFRGYHVMRGYYDDPAATAEAVDTAGWLHSGDLGAMDARGYVRITGRRKEMIIRGGENIYPAEIEAWLFTHPQVAQVAVFGMPDRRYGEIVAAWVQLHPGATVDPEALKAFAAEGLAYFKVPETIRFVETFPMTVTGKIQKFRLREIEAAERRERNPEP